MDVFNIIATLLVHFIMCDQVFGQKNSAGSVKHESSVHSIIIDNKENNLRKTNSILEKAEAPLKYTKNDYEYKPLISQISSNSTQRKGINDSESILPKMAIPEASPKYVAKKHVETAIEAIKAPVVHSEYVEEDESETKTTQQEKSAAEYKNIGNKDDCSSDSDVNDKKSLSPSKTQTSICADSKSENKVNLEEGNLPHRRFNKVNKLFFEETDDDYDGNVKSTPIVYVYKTKSNKKSNSSEPTVRREKPKKEKSDKKDMINQNKSAIPTEQPKNKTDTRENATNVKNVERNSEKYVSTNEPIIYENNFKSSWLSTPPIQSYQENMDVTSLLRSAVDENLIGPTDDIVVKTYNVEEVVKTPKVVDAMNDLSPSTYSTNNNKDNTGGFYYPINYMQLPKNTLDTPHRYVQTAQTTSPTYGYNNPRNYYGQNYFPQQNYYYNNFAQYYNPYNTYLREYWNQNMNPKAIGQNFAHPSASESFNGIKPDYTFIPPSYKYPFEDQLREIVKGTTNSQTRNRGDNQKQPGLYSYYPPNIYDFNRMKYPIDNSDQIKRVWRNTEIHIKKPQYQGNINIRKVDKIIPTYYNNQWKRVINGNGYY